MSNASGPLLAWRSSASCLAKSSSEADEYCTLTVTFLPALDSCCSKVGTAHWSQDASWVFFPPRTALTASEMVTGPVAFGVELVEDCPQAAATSRATAKNAAFG